jgi:DNA uptake protein ComE-like DNA-binding protein
MNANELKFARRLGDPSLAAKLIKAGLRNPGDIRHLDDKQLEDIPGIGKATVAQLRKVYPTRKQ